MTEYQMLSIEVAIPRIAPDGSTYVCDSIRYLELCGIKPEHTREIIKKRLLWGTYGKYAEHSLKLVRLIDCSTDHLQNILRTETHVCCYMREIIIEIIKDRAL